ncbi:GerAB/ArcD/ProY family transporter [Paenibacillus glycinis]|nr:GerAB/ArcD/ProY family transporter [Paenibacillus glycinis]
MAGGYELRSVQNERLTVSPYLALVLIHSIQFGLGYLSMSIKPVQFAGHDAWISVLLTGIGFHIIIWMIYQLLNRNRSDIIEIHRQFFGKWVGGALNFLFIVYFLINSSYQLRLFIEVIQVWLFPELETWALALVLLLLIYYIVSSGFRVILGICTLSLAQHTLIFSMLFTAPFFHFANLKPVLDHSLNDLVLAAKEMTFPYMGVEILLFCYTFIKNPEKSQKWAQIGNAITMFFYLLVIFFSILLFKYEQLAKEIWPEFTKYKFVHMPFIERFDFIGATCLIFGLFPISCLFLWASSRTMKITFGTRQLTALAIFILLVFIVVCCIPNRKTIESVQMGLSKVGLVIVYVYIPCMYLTDLVRWKARRA